MYNPTRTRNVCEFVTTFTPVPELSILVLTVVYTPNHTLQRTSVTSVGHSYPYPELLEVLYARATIPGSSGSFVRLSYPYPELLKVL